MLNQKKLNQPLLYKTNTLLCLLLLLAVVSCGPAGITPTPATAVVNEDGTFTVPVAPLPAGIRIGLTADVETIGLTLEDIQPGEGEISVPQAGYFYDSYVMTEN
jgi:hypothetical protein